MATLPSTDPAARDAVPELCRIVRLGTVPYREAWDLQVEIADRVRRGLTPDTLLLLEHPHTYTRGRLSPDTHLLLDQSAVASRGAEIVETDRGGLITYHGRVSWLPTPSCGCGAAAGRIGTCGLWSRLSAAAWSNLAWLPQPWMA